MISSESDEGHFQNKACQIWVMEKSLLKGGLDFKFAMVFAKVRAGF